MLSNPTCTHKVRLSDDPAKREYQRLKAREWYQKNKAKAQAQRRARYLRNHATERAYTLRHYHRDLRGKILEVMGGKCVRCGFTDKRALQIDHINGGGLAERKAKGECNRLYDYYLKHPEQIEGHLQLLCANCNWIKRAETFEHRRQQREVDYDNACTCQCHAGRGFFRWGQCCTAYHDYFVDRLRTQQLAQVGKN